MSAITTKFVTDHELTNEMSLEELSQNAPEILELLTDDKEKRRQARNRLLNGYKFSKEQVFVLIPLRRVGRCKSQAPVPEGSGLEAEEVNTCQVSDSTCTEETIKETAQRIVRDKLSERDVKAISRTLIETASDSIVALSRLSRLRRELRTLDVPETIISATFNPEVTRLSNKIQKERSDQRENEGIDFSDHFSLESVREKLNLYDVSNIPDKQALADVMIMLCIRLAEIKNLRISNGGVTGELLIWIQKAISSGQLRDPRKLRSTYLSTFLKKDEFIPKTESRKPLLPSSLRKLGAVFAVVSNGAKNLSEAMTIASQALRHSLDNYVSQAPLIQEKIESQSNTSPITKVVSLDPDEEEDLDGPMEIDFVKKKEPKTSVATVKCKIKRLKIPAMTVDSGAEPPIITENIVERVGAKIDKSETHNLSGIATVPVESVGVVHKLPITLAPGCTIHEDFIVVKYQKPTLIFSNQLLKKYNCALDWKTNELKIPLNGKDYIIPVTMHKVKNKIEVNCANITPDCDDFST
ncbi:hypothetical protein C2G38_2207098 [Gigaspora rosea]|uniref:Uncharacterized protein n=1 Tax=Gigaspora rosea TaxID=44941 RepID=A0A397ULF9_9GLOM|nr:hypothetical protein C2G38_2207098 [Gigaspora rosea]